MGCEIYTGGKPFVEPAARAERGTSEIVAAARRVPARRWARGLLAGREAFAMSAVLLLVLVLLLIGMLPAWPYSRGWGFYPSGGVGILLVVLLLFAALGRGPVGP
jgi:hypothetical protein